MIETYRGSRWLAIASAVAIAMACGEGAAVEVTSAGGWSASFDGNISAHLVTAKASTLGGTSSDVTDTRVTSGWNPSKFNAHFKAPEFEGITVTGNFQYATNITGANQDGFGTTNGNRNLDVDVRVLEVDATGAFGTVVIGRGWGIFDSQAILNDTGSGIGTGELCGTPANWNGGTCGRIGTGYHWTAFNSKVEYDTPDLGGFALRVGLFDPTNVGGQFSVHTPRVEAEGTYASKFQSGGYKIWVGGVYQGLQSLAGSPSAKISGVNGGLHVDIGGLGLTGSYTDTKGFGGGNSSVWGGGGFVGGFGYGAANGAISCYSTSATGVTSLTPTASGAGSCTAARAKQWYAEADYTIGKALFGVSAGQGKQSADARAGFSDIKTDLDMAYWHQKLTTQLTLVVEYDYFKGKSAGVADNKYSLFSVGGWFDF
jgi:hypothetical protein